jgi:hypothetical protein
MKECINALCVLLLVSCYFFTMPTNTYATDTNYTSSGLGLLSFNLVKANQTYDSGLDAFEIYNSGGVAMDTTIAGTDLVGGIDWTLSDTCVAGNNTYGMKAGLDGGSYNVTIKKTATYNLLISDLASLASQKFGIQMHSPTEFSDGVIKTGSVILTITAH